jgi:hypothetical protein
MQRWRGAVFILSLIAQPLLIFVAPAAALTATDASSVAEAPSSVSPPGATSGSTLPRSSDTPSSAATAPAAPANVAPAWVLCPPSDVTMTGPFLEGTDLTCAPQ